ncbi:MAG: Cell division ATP-binding protein FtsE [Candidatus Amesbacteria bacterium GW2011_GWC1_47_15]|uniref:Cell division ATP-binding protein FtsE n=1 Tax=Candidatus Amesbacteria bacterium GW2011_GWC1_47_15 TaxID=1618364 RepID=A0A0G1S4H5_9BACT|nr:MAG: Cell division ATP-binding protein FtsE [Candidatus Amesbacteria bacterium GW2011_GWC1_47_15]
MVTARNLTKKFGDITALWDITFNIEPGEFVFLTGTSGSGKTTLFRLIMRNLGLTAGELVVDGKHVHKIKTKDLPAYRRRIGPVFQDFKLLSDRSVWENIALPLEVRSIKPADIASSVKIALEMVGLTDRSHLFPGQLSGGELQRVGLARAVVSKPKLILADEPTGNLDPKTAHSIVSLLKEIHEELKTTVIMATHNADIVNRFGLRVITLSEGKLIKDSPKGKYDE